MEPVKFKKNSNKITHTLWYTVIMLYDTKKKLAADRLFKKMFFMINY